MGRKNKRAPRGAVRGRRQDLRRGKPKPCQVWAGAVAEWKDTSTGRKDLAERGKIRSRGVTGLCPRDQRRLASAVKNEREMDLLPYVGDGR